MLPPRPPGDNIDLLVWALVPIVVVFWVQLRSQGHWIALMLFIGSGAVLFGIGTANERRFRRRRR